MTAAQIRATAPTRPPHPRSIVVMVIVAIGVAAGMLVGDDSGHSSKPRTLSGPAHAFKLDYPRGWAPASQADLASTPERPDAMVSRRDGRGAVLVRRRGPLEQPLSKLGPALVRDVKTRMPDARPVSTRMVRLTTGPALSHTFVRQRSGLVQGIVVAPVGAHTYTLESVALGDAEDVARDIGSIVRSFRR